MLLKWLIHKKNTDADVYLDVGRHDLAYNTRLEEKIDAAAKRWLKVERKKMFGRICYLLKARWSSEFTKIILSYEWTRNNGNKALKTGMFCLLTTRENPWPDGL